MNWDNLDAEIKAHIEEKALGFIESGIPKREAWERARKEFGNPTLAVESSRRVWVLAWLENLGQDLHYAVRAMAANRLFTFLVILSLALGIGANTAIYSFLDAILLRSLPVQDPQSLTVLKFQRPGMSGGRTRGSGSKGKMRVHITSGGSFDGRYSAFPYPAFELFHSRSDLFATVFAYHGTPETRLVVNREATLGDCVYVSGDYFPGLGVTSGVGRMLTSDDDRAGSPPVSVISAGFAERWYGSPNNAIGKTVAVNGQSFTIVGITPPSFFGANPEWTPEVYLPLHTYLLTQPARFTEGGKLFVETSTYWLDVMARLKPNVTRKQAQAALDPIFAEYFQQFSGPTPDKTQMIVMEGAGGLDSLRHDYAQPLYVLMAMVGLILTIACANIANLLLARGAARRREIAVRLSIGASRSRVVRQLLTESLVLSLAGGACGLLIAWWCTRMLTALLAVGREDFTLRASLNWPVLAATFGLALVTGVVFGLGPAWRSTKLDVFPALRETLASANSPKRRWLPVNIGQVLIVAQIALSLLLLIGAGLFIRTLSKLQSLDLGFNRENLLLLEVNTQQAGYNGPAALAFHETLRERFASIPGVRNATLAAEGQLDGGTWNLGFNVPDSLTEIDTGAPVLPVGPEYLTTMQIPILLGRDINMADGQRTPVAAVISQSFAKKHFGTDNPLGRRMSMDYDGGYQLEVVGVAKDARYGHLKDDPAAMLYVDYRHTGGFLIGVIRVVLRTAGDPTQVTNTARQILHETDPGVPLGKVGTQAAQIDSTINQEIIFARLCAVFAMLALLIACVGLYGTTAYSVARRTSEIGICMALGAQRATVLRMVLREVAILALAGLAIGLLIALGASRVVASFLFELQPNDPSTIGGAIAVLLASALLAALAPAKRASRIDPMTALRHE